MKNLLNNLTQTFGPSGYENEIRGLIQNEIESCVDEMYVDALGNLIARKGKLKDGGKRIMISAHMDELGVMVSHIDENGFVYIAFIGGINPLTCFGSRVKFINGTEGVVYAETKKMHIVPDVTQLFVDVGATSKADCPLKTGDIGVFVRPFLDLGNRVVSKALDDRIGCLVVIEALKIIKESPNELYFVFSVQEEVGIRGAVTSAYAIDPDMGIAVDVTIAADIPYGEKANPVLGKGPCVKVRDGNLIANPNVINAMTEAAEQAGIPYQMEVLRFAGTDAGAIQFARSGVPAGCLSIACRYVHSPSEMVDWNDTQNSIRLLTELLEKPVKL
ncbi:MAG: M42 family metallopeptidase [Flexilinea sp.]